MAAPRSRPKPTPTLDERRARAIARRRAQDLAKLEETIHQQEQTIQRLGEDLQSASETRAFERLPGLSREYAAAQREHEELLAEWEKLSTE